MSTLILRLNEGDATVTAHATRLKKGNSGSQLVTVSSGLDKVGKLKKGDKLFVIGHGSPSKLGKFSAAELAEVLAKADLVSGVTIELVACKSGASGAPFALELKNQLVSKKIVPAKVTGGTNNMQVKQDGTPYTKTPGATGTEVTAGRRTENTPWGTRTRNVDPTYRTGNG